jgi:hypothetical protein
MKITVSVSIQDGDDTPAEVCEVFALERGALAPGTVGLQLDEAKDLLAAVQEKMVAGQAAAALAETAACPRCGGAHRHKDSRDIVVRTLFGTPRLSSPRWWRCPCSPGQTRTFGPLAAALPDRSTPELFYLEAKFAALASYGTSARLLAEILPLGRRLHATALRFHAQAVAQRLEDELGPEQHGFIEGCPAVWEELPRPDLALVVALDGGYVHSSAQTSRADGWKLIRREHVPGRHRRTFPRRSNPDGEHLSDMNTHAQQNRPIQPQRTRRYLTVMLNVVFPLDDPSRPVKYGDPVLPSLVVVRFEGLVAPPLPLRGTQHEFSSWPLPHLGMNSAH